LLVEPPREEGSRSPAFAVFAAQVRAGQSFTEPIGASSWRFPALKISTFHVNVFAILFLFAATAFTVGLTVGRGPVGKRLREPPQSLLVTDAKPPALPDAMPDASDESTLRTPPPPVTSSDDSAAISRPADAAPSAEKSIEGPPGAGPAEARSTNVDSSHAVEPKPSAKPELHAEHNSEIAPMVRSMRPPASSKILGRPKRVRSTRTARRIPSPYRLTSTMAATPHAIGSASPLPRTSTILVNLPDQESQPFRVSFPNKTISATSSLAMTSQLSVLVSPEPWPVVAHKSARLEAGELVSFVWPHFPGPRGRYGWAETIRVRASIGQTGQVQEVKLLGGSASLLPATVEAIRQWRYRPTLMDKRPVQAQQDITIEFRPPQYSAHLSTPHPPHN
jgi:TonB-like protein